MVIDNGPMDRGTEDDLCRGEDASDGAQLDHGYDLGGGMRDAAESQSDFRRWLRDGQFHHVGADRDERDKACVRRAMSHEWEARVTYWKRRAERAESLLKQDVVGPDVLHVDGSSFSGGGYD